MSTPSQSSERKDALLDLYGQALMAADKHRPNPTRGGCECGFCAYSAEHVVAMVHQEIYEHALHVAFGATDQAIRERDEARAAVARVEALCAHAHAQVRDLHITEVRAALSGGAGEDEDPVAIAEALDPQAVQQWRQREAARLREEMVEIEEQANDRRCETCGDIHPEGWAAP